MKRRTFIRWLLVFLASFSGIGLLIKKLFSAGVTHAVVNSVKEAKVPQPVNESGSLLNFFLLSDLHVSAGNSRPSKHLREALDDVQNFSLDTIVVTGDLTDLGMDQDYAELKKIMSSYQLPTVYGNMGNHDYYDIWIDSRGSFNQEAMPNGKTDALSRERFMNFMGYDKPFRDVWIKGYHFVMLSQECYVEERPEVGEGAWYSDEQLAWFQDVLQQHKDHKPFFVMIHQPLPPQGKDGGTHQLIRAKEFRKILQNYRNAFVFSGHQHRDFRIYTENHYVKETFHWFHNSSVGRVLNYKTRQEVTDASQGLYVEVHEDHVSLQAREFTNQTWIPGAEWKIPYSV